MVEACSNPHPSGVYWRRPEVEYTVVLGGNNCLLYFFLFWLVSFQSSNSLFFLSSRIKFLFYPLSLFRCKLCHCDTLFNIDNISTHLRYFFGAISRNNKVPLCMYYACQIFWPIIWMNSEIRFLHFFLIMDIRVYCKTRHVGRKWNFNPEMTRN